MPELPDVTVYCEALERRVAGQPLQRVRLVSPFVLRSVEPRMVEAEGRTVQRVRRVGKRVVLALDERLFLVIHLMIAGRLHWKPAGKRGAGRSLLAELEFPNGTLTLTEAGSKRRASIHLVRGEEALAAFDRGGLEVLGSDVDAFRDALVRESRTLKRALADPRLFSGIGNAYSDEILHRARLPPTQLTRNLDEEETARLHAATQAVLEEWLAKLRAECGEGFPEKVTAFREGFAVHGRYKQPCPDCGSPVQRIVRGDVETNYCARCQCGGRLLADRALSRLLRHDWPKTLDELES